jgi:hypothetical protein
MNAQPGYPVGPAYYYPAKPPMSLKTKIFIGVGLVSLALASWFFWGWIKYGTPNPLDWGVKKEKSGNTDVDVTLTTTGGSSSSENTVSETTVTHTEVVVQE